MPPSSLFLYRASPNSTLPMQILPAIQFLGFETQLPSTILTLQQHFSKASHGRSSPHTDMDLTYLHPRGPSGDEYTLGRLSAPRNGRECVSALALDGYKYGEKPSPEVLLFCIPRCISSSCPSLEKAVPRTKRISKQTYPESFSNQDSTAVALLRYDW